MAKSTVFVTGGAGYCGSRLIPQLLDRGYMVTVYDILYFGSEFLPLSDPNLTLIEGDIRDTEKLATSCKNHDTFISLACISNDASFELDEGLSTTINFDAFEPMVIAAKQSGVSRFIYASTSSVYGISSNLNVTEEHPLKPLTLYNDYKGKCEPLLIKHTDDNFVGVIFRPATVCGFAPRLRLDLTVNILTNHAVNKDKITVFGGDQLRPNLHIGDYCDVVELFMSAPADLIANQIFNVGYQNRSINDIARIVKKVVEKEFNKIGGIDIVVTPTDDKRSYHINSDKIKTVLGFSPRLTIEDAVRELCIHFKEGEIPNSFNDDFYFNVKRLKRLNAR